ncbi:MAG: SPASM domain-containing protein [Halanaerobiales bacterium]|nr:SPASM domain-containing protein [Halanaerobiales bacterium]
MLKRSRFNLMVDKEDFYLLYNTLTKKFSMITKKLYDHLDLLNEKECYQLKQRGFLINKNFDEKVILDYTFNKQRFSSKSLSIIYLPTLDCNLDCDYCFQKTYRNKKREEVTSEAIGSWILSNVTNNIERIVINFYGGEPLLEIDKILNLKKYINSFTSKDIELVSSLTTNGYLLDEDFIKKFKKDSTISGIQITIHDIENFDTQYHLQVYENIRKTCEFHPEISLAIRFDVNRINHKYIMRVLDNIPKANSLSITLVPILPWDEDSAKNPHKYFLYEDSSYQELFEFKKTVKDLGFKINTRLDYSCKMISKTNAFVIDPEGFIYKCDGMAGQNEYSIGHIENYKLNYKQIYIENLWNIWDKCNQCEVLPICMGGCKYRNFYNNYSANICNKELIKEEIKFYMDAEDLDVLKIIR